MTRIFRSNEEWREIVNSYNPKEGSIIQFCKKNNVSESGFYAHRRKFTVEKKPTFVPAVVTKPKQDICFKVNDISITVNDSIDDNALSRIIGICSKL